MSARSHEPVAIVGIGCLFPGSTSLDRYWANILSARDCISDVPKDHSWSPSDYYDPDPSAPDKTWCTRGGFLEKVPFDPLSFGIPPAMLESIDTAQLLSLIVAREALKDAGIDPDAHAGWDRDRVSVILGITGTQEMAITAGARLQGPIWRKSLLRCGVDPALADIVVRDIASHFPTWTEQTFPGLLGNVVSGRIANRLDLGGTNAVVDAACASSLAAMQYAIADLLAGRSDLVLTGGADTLNDIFMYECFTRTPAFTKRGDARPFDESADGILIGEGIAICALKRLSDAERDGDRVYAVIKGLGSSSDGRYKSIYAPNPDGQAKALRRAYEAAGFGPETVELVEAHGTGTRAGDAAEIEALTRVYRGSGRSDRWVTLGSVKSQIGHTKSTAGAAGLVKAALALYQQVLPPTAKIDRPNPKMGFEKSPFYLSLRARPWIRAADAPRRAAVSAFGFGGSNFHAVLEEHGAPSLRAAISPAETELFVLSADDDGELLAKVRALVSEARTAESIPALARASYAGYRPGAARIVSFIASSVEQLDERLATLERRLSGQPMRPLDDLWLGGGAPAKMAWLIPGQGSQYVEMGRTLGLRHRAFRAALDAADEDCRNASVPRLSGLIYPPQAFSSAEEAQQQEALRRTDIAQPAIGAVSKGMVDLLRSFGLSPAAAAGHSYGELVALYVAGVLDGDGLRAASRERGLRMAQVSGGSARGGMLAVDMDREHAAQVAEKYGLVIANTNHPSQVALSGERSAVETAVRELSASGVSAKELLVGAAFHSPLVADAVAPFAEALAKIPIHPAEIPVFGCATGAPYPSDPEAVRRTLAEQLVSEVSWPAVIDGLWSSGVRTFVEVGPKGVLAGLTERCLQGREAAVLSLDRRAGKTDGDTDLKRTLAALAALGHPLDLAPLLRERCPAPERRPKDSATVWLGGANYRKPETLEPPLPDLPRPDARATREPANGAAPQASSDALGWAAVPSSGRPMERPVHLEVARQQPEQPRAAQLTGAQPALARGDLLALLDSTRQTLAAFQEAQARTADVHSRFLDTTLRANESFARLFEAQTRLISAVASGGVIEAEPVPHTPPQHTAPIAPASPAPVAAPSPQAAMVAARPADAAAPMEGIAGLGPVALPTSARPSVAADLPPIFDAKAAVEAKAAPRPAAAKPASAPDTRPLEDVLLAAVSSKTGYPKESLALSMDLEGDLGVDSIKRVEILSAVREALPGLPEVPDETLAALRTLGDVARVLGSTVRAQSAPQSVPVTRGIGRSGLVEVLLAAVSSKTGYPKESLALSMDLEGDLGVDSIKRVEILSAVREALPDLPEIPDETLAALRTLGDVADKLVPAGAAAEMPEVLRPKAVLSRDRLVEVLLAAVSSKTGYPKESLALSMDLEGDLGVDSIKRVEILSAVREALPDLPEIPDETLAALRTLGDVADHLGGAALGLGFASIGSAAKTDRGPALIVPPAAPEVSPAPAPGLPPVQSISDLLSTGGAGASPVPVSLRRREVALIEAPARLDRSAWTGLWALMADRGEALAREIARGLAARGIMTAVFDADWSNPKIPIPGNCVGAVYLAAVGAGEDDAEARVKGAFHFAKAVAAARGGAPPQRFVTLSDRGGRFGRTGATGQPVTGALSGLVKTLAREWPEATCTAIDIHPETPADRIVAEILGDRGVPEVGLRGDAVYTLTEVDALEEPHALPLHPNDLIVATGAGRSVTAACLAQLASNVPLSVLVLGRTPLQDEPEWAVGVADDALVRSIFSAKPGAVSPRQAEEMAASVRGAREIRATLTRLVSEGCFVRYEAVDGRDAERVRSVIAAAVARHGPVRALLHGAGVLADKRLIDKTPEQFESVWSTKVGGFRALLDAVDERELRLVIAFSSVAGRFGNPGQCDYAMANEALVQEICALRERAPHVRACAIDWGPWDGGMVNASLKAHFTGRGVGLIPLAQGAAAMVEAARTHASEIVIEGPRPHEGAKPLPLRAAQPWLRDHAVPGPDGRPQPVLPLAMVVEAMAELCDEIDPGRAALTLRDLRVLKGVRLEKPEVTLSLTWQQGGPSALIAEILSESAQPHYRALVDLSEDALRGDPLPDQGPPAAGVPLARDPYLSLFHGKSYQVLAAVELSERGASGRIQPRKPAELGVGKARWQTDPLAIDAALQLVLVWAKERFGVDVLPMALGALHFRRDAGPIDRVSVQIDGGARTGRFMAVLSDADGRVVGRIDGGEYAARPSAQVAHLLAAGLTESAGAEQ